MLKSHFLIYGEDSDEEVAAELKESNVTEIEAEREPESSIIDEPREELPPINDLNVEISSLLQGRGRDVMEMYRDMELSVRDTYQEISRLDLPPISRVNQGLAGSPIAGQPVSTPPVAASRHKSPKAKPKKCGPIKLTSQMYKIPFLSSLPTSTEVEDGLDVQRAALERVLKIQIEKQFNSQAKSPKPNGKYYRWGNSIEEEPKLVIPKPKRNIQSAKTHAENQNSKKKTAARKARRTVLSASSSRSDNFINPKKIPLEWFEQTPLAEHSHITKLIKAAIEAGDIGVPAFSKFRFTSINDESATDWKWKKCFVVDFDGKKEQYLIQWDGLNLKKWVRRFNLLFPGEKQDQISQRIEKAVNERSLLEEEFEQYLRITNMEVEGMAPYPTGWKSTILKRFGRKIQKSELPIIEACFFELEADYIFAMKSALLRIKDKAAPTSNAVDAEKFASITIQKAKLKKSDDITNVLFGKVAQAAKGLSVYMFSANSELHRVIFEILNTLPKLLNQLNFEFFGFKSYGDSLGSFYSKAINIANSIQCKLVIEWPDSLCQIILNNLNDFFNFQETNFKSYQNSRCKQFLGLVNAIVEGQLYNLVVSGIIQYLGLFGVTVEERQAVEQDKKEMLQYETSFRFFGPKSGVKPARAFIKLRITIEDEKKQLYDQENNDELIRNPENEIVLVPSWEETQKMMHDMLDLPISITLNSVPGIETILLKSLVLPSGKFVKTIDKAQNKFYKDANAVLAEILYDAEPRVKAILQFYKDFEDLVRFSPSDVLNSSSPLDEFVPPVKSLNSIKKSLLTKSNNFVEVPPFIIDCSLIKKLCQSLIDNSLHSISNLLSNRIGSQCTDLLGIYNPLAQQLKTDPGLVAKLWVELESTVENSSKEIENFNSQFEDIEKTWNLMYELSMEIPKDVQDRYWTTYQWPTAIQADLDLAKKRLDVSKRGLLSKINTETGYINESILAAKRMLNGLLEFNNVKYLGIAISKIKDITVLLNSTMELSESVIKQEEALHMHVSDFRELKDVNSTFKLHKTLWEVVEDIKKNINSWSNEWFSNLNAAAVDAKVHGWLFALSECENELDYDSPSKMVLDQISLEFHDFWRNTKIIIELRSPALKEDHWDQLFPILGLNQNDLHSLKLDQILKIDLELVQGIIADIVLQAKEHYKTELELESLKETLTNSEIQFVNDSRTGFAIYSNLDEVKSIFEDQLVVIENLYPKEQNESLRRRFETTTTKILSALDIVNSFQEINDFLLETGDIRKLLSLDALHKNSSLEMAFASLQKSMFQISEIILKNKKLVTLMYREDIKDLILSCKARISTIRSGFQIVINKKREEYPRLYFVDDDLLVAILAAKNIPELSKCISDVFPPCFKLTEIIKRRELMAPSFKREMELQTQRKLLGDKVKLVDSVIGHDGEKLVFKDPIEWNSNTVQVLQNIESSIKVTLKSAAKDVCLVLENILEFPNLFGKYPMQICLLAVRIVIDDQLSQFSKKKDKSKLDEFQITLKSIIDCLCEKLKDNSHSSVTRIQLESAILTLLFYTMRAQSNYPALHMLTHSMDELNNITISFPDTRHFSYGFEYLGIESRIYITDPMVRTFHHIFQAVSESKTPLVVGGTDNSELFEELSWLIGQRIITFTCKLLDLNTLQKVLNGYMLSNICVVLKNSEMLSGAVKKTMNGSASNFTLQSEDSLKMPIIMTTNSILKVSKLGKISLNKYRLIGTFAPDRAQSFEVILIVKGYRNAASISKKCELAFQACEGLLNFPITRKIFKKIVEISAELKFNSPHLGDNILFRNSIYYYFKCSVNFQYLQSVKEILNTIFKSSGEDKIGEKVTGLFNSACGKLNLTPTAFFGQRVIQFFKAIDQRTSIILLGSPCSGKTSLWKTAMAMANSLFPSALVKPFVVFPNSLEFKGLQQSNSEDYEKLLFGGVLQSARVHAEKMEKLPALTEYLCSFSWIIMDGSFQPDWIDYLQSALEVFENSYKRKDLLQLIYETNSISNASPSVLFDSNLIYLDSEEVKIKNLLVFLIQSSGNGIITKGTAFLQAAFHGLLIPVSKFMKNGGWLPNQSSTDRFCTIRVFNLFKCLVVQTGSKGHDRLTSSEQFLWLLFAIVYSIIWVIGADAYLDRKHFDQFFRKLLQNSIKVVDELEEIAGLEKGFLTPSLIFPDELLVFDYILDESILRWVEWKPIARLSNYTSPLNFEEDLQAINSFKFQYLMELYTINGIPTLVAGQTSSGKSAAAYRSLISIREKNPALFYQQIGAIFSWLNNSGNDFRTEIYKHFPKKRQSVRGHKSGKTKIVFVDDLDLCYSSKNNALDVIRMLLATNHWYDLDGKYEKVVDFQLVGCFTTSASRMEWSSNWAGYFSVINTPPEIDTTIRDISLNRISKHFNRINIKYDICSRLVDAVIKQVDLLQCRFEIRNNNFKFNLHDYRKLFNVIFNVDIQLCMNSSSVHEIISFTLQQLCVSRWNIRHYDLMDGNSVENRCWVPKKLQTNPFPIQPEGVHNLADLIANLPITFSLKSLKTIENLTSLRQIWRCTFAIQHMGTNVVITGHNFSNRSLVAEIVAELTGKKYFAFPNSSKETWSSFMASLLHFCKENDKPVLIYLKSSVWDEIYIQDIALMMQYGIIAVDQIGKEDFFEFNTSTGKNRQICIIVSMNGTTSTNNSFLMRNARLFSNTFTLHSEQWDQETILAYLNGELNGVHGWGEFLPKAAQFFAEAFEESKSISRLDICDPDSVEGALKSLRLLFQTHALKIQEFGGKCMNTSNNIKDLLNWIEQLYEQHDNYAKSTSSFQNQISHILVQIENERMEIDFYNAKAEKEKEIITKLEDEIDQLGKLIDSETEKLLPEIEICLEELKGLQRGDIYDLKGLVEVSPAVLATIEAVILLVKFEKKQTESIWDTGKRMISEKSFITNLTKASKPDYILGPILIHSVSRIVKRDGFNDPNLAPFAAKALRNWVLAVLKYHSTHLSLVSKRDLKTELESQRVQRHLSLKQFNDLVTEHQAKTESLKKSHHQITSSNQSVILKMKEIDLQITNTQGLKTSLMDLYKVLEAALNEQNERKRQLIGSCILCVAIAYFTGMLSEKHQQTLTANWKNKLSSFGIELPAQFNFTEIIDFYRVPDNIITDFNLYNQLLCAKLFTKIPLLIDPLDISCRYLQYVERETKVLPIHFSDAKFWAEFESAFERLYVVFIYINNFEDLQSLTEIIIKRGYGQSDRNKSRIYLRIKELFASPNYNEWLYHYSPLIITQNEPATAQSITSTVCKIQNPDLESKYSLKVAEFQLARIKRQILVEKIISDFPSSIDGAVSTKIYTKLIDLNDQYQASVFKEEVLMKSIKKMSEDYRIFENIGTALSLIWCGVYEIRSINPLYSYSFDCFLKICQEKALSLNGVSFSGKRYCEEVIRTIFLTISAALKHIDRIVFGFRLAQITASTPFFEKQDLAFSPELLYFFVNNEINEESSMKSERPQIKNTSKAWLSEKSWELLLELDRLPNFESFASDFSKYGNRATTPATESCWQDIFESRDPTKLEFPSKWQFELLKPEKFTVIRCLRPELFPILCYEYTKSVFGSAIVESAYSACAIHQRLKMSSAREAIVVHCDQISEPVPVLSFIAASLQVEETIVLNPKTTTTEVEDLTTRLKSIGNNWIIIDLRANSTENEVIIPIWLSSLFEQAIYSKFWVLTNGHLHLTEVNYTRMFLENEFEFKNIFYESILYLMKYRNQIENSQDVHFKKLMFNVCVFYSILKIRMMTPPITIDNYTFILGHDLQMALERVIAHYEINKEKIGVDIWSSELVIRKQFEQSWGFKFLKNADLEWGYSLFLYCVTLDWEEDKKSDDKKPPLKSIYNSYLTSDFNLTLERVNSLPRGIDFDLTTLGYSDGIYKIIYRKMIPSVLDTLTMIYGYKKLSVVDKYAVAASELVSLEEKLCKQVSNSWIKDVDVREMKKVSGKTDKTHRNSMEVLAYSNFERYRAMIWYLVAEVKNLNERLNNRTFNRLDLLDLEEIENNIVPTKWKKSGLMYISNLDYQQWVTDLFGRLKFVKTWHSVRIEGIKSTETLAFYDMPKLFAPEELFPAIKLEYAHLMNDSMDNIEFETLFISEKQKVAPEKGIYITGLYLYGASVDPYKKILKPSKSNETWVKFPAVLNANADLVATETKSSPTNEANIQCKK